MKLSGNKFKRRKKYICTFITVNITGSCGCEKKRFKNNYHFKECLSRMIKSNAEGKVAVLGSPLNCILVKNCTCMWQNILFVPGFHTLYLRSCNVFLSDFFLWLSFLWFQTPIHGILKQKPVSKGAGFSYVFLL